MGGQSCASRDGQNLCLQVVLRLQDSSVGIVVFKVHRPLPGSVVAPSPFAVFAKNNSSVVSASRLDGRSDLLSPDEHLDVSADDDEPAEVDLLSCLAVSFLDLVFQTDMIRYHGVQINIFLLIFGVDYLISSPHNKNKPWEQELFSLPYGMLLMSVYRWLFLKNERIQ